MTLLSVVRDIALETGFPLPASVINNNANDVRQLLSACKLTVKDLAPKRWVCLIREHTFQTAANIADYALPNDFGSLVSDTVWNRSRSDPTGALASQDWQVYKSGLTNSVAFDQWRIKVKQGVNRFYIEPTPTGVETWAFEYRSKYSVRDADDAQTFKETFDKDGDVFLISEYLLTLGGIWRFLKRQGEAYAEEKDEYDHQVSIAYAQDPGSRLIMMGQKRAGIVANVGQVGINGYVND